MNFRDIYESIIDQPHDDGLSRDIWTKTNNKYTLLPEAKNIIQQVIDWAESQFEVLKDSEIHIIGSICSNQYSNKSDIDVHFCPVDVDKILNYDEFNLKFKNLFEEQLPNININGYLIEIYCQKNKFQDMMSVGCYDFKTDTWKCGPELQPDKYDPLALYYFKSQKEAQDIIETIRQSIFKCYEIGEILRISNDTKFHNDLKNKLIAEFKFIEKLYENIKNSRKVLSEPKTYEEAMKNRNSEQWKIVDTAFKLLDKFGYMAILKQYKKLLNKIDNYTAKELGDEIINIFNNNSLDEHEYINESFKNLSLTMCIATLLSIPGILPAKDLNDNFKNIPKSEFNINSDKVQNAIVKTSKDVNGDNINGLAVSNVVNAITRTLYREGRDESKKGIHAIASVIWNRANKDPNNFISVISAKSQFSCWNAYSGGWVNTNFVYNIPSDELKNKRNKNTWNYARLLASQMIKKNFKSSIGNRNCYLNMKTASKTAKQTWGNLCDLTIGNHSFGYQKRYDKSGKPQEYKIYIVQKDDTLSGIAKKLNTTVKRLMYINKIKNANRIKINQKILY